MKIHKDSRLYCNIRFANFYDLIGVFPLIKNFTHQAHRKSMSTFYFSKQTQAKYEVKIQRITEGSDEVQILITESSTTSNENCNSRTS